MENLRWILLGIGIILVILVFLRGYYRKKNHDYSPLDAANDVPSFSARDEADDSGWKDGVGPVRVVNALDHHDVDALVDELKNSDTLDDKPEDSVLTKEQVDEVEAEAALDGWIHVAN